jgi:hypothetical protein
MNISKTTGRSVAIQPDHGQASSLTATRKPVPDRHSVHGPLRLEPDGVPLRA